jgi:hypothetical protein
MTVLSLLSEGALAHGGALRDSIGTPATGAALLYALAAATGLAAARRDSGSALDRRVWQAATLMLALLSVNCLVHADRAVVLSLREVAHDGGWYAQRRPLQWTTLGVLLGVAGFALPALVRFTRKRVSPGLYLVIAGLCLQATLLALRLVSLHHTDFVLDFRLAGLSLGRWVEALALGLVMVSALGALAGPTRRPFKKKPHV